MKYYMLQSCPQKKKSSVLGHTQNHTHLYTQSGK